MTDKYCAGCHDSISRYQKHLVVNELQSFFHPNCLTCTGCRNILRGPFCLWNGNQPLCDRCLEDRSPVCEDCKYPVSDVKLRTKLGVFHPDCFVCTTCKFPFINDESKQYFNIDGRPYCQRDAIYESERPQSRSLKNIFIVGGV